MARAVYPPMRVLCLADQKTPAMDKLQYFKRQSDRIMPRLLTQAETITENLLTDTMQEVMEAPAEPASTA